MYKPNFKEAQFDQYKLIVLGQLREAGYSFGKFHYTLNAGRDQ